jgi:hypothetical protein
MITQSGQENGRFERQIETAIESPADDLKNEPVYYSFTMSSAQSVDGLDQRIFAGCVRGASPRRFTRVYRPF